jgi:hypothetical protein
MSSTRESGERDQRKSGSMSGLPIRAWNCASSGAQYGGIDLISVSRLEGPTTSTAQRKRSGVNAAPRSAA